MLPLSQLLKVQSRVPRIVPAFKMSTSKYQPPVNRNMRTLDRSYFKTTVPLCVVYFPDPKNISVFSKRFKDYILRVPRIPHVIKLDEGASGTHPQDSKKTVACDNGLVKKGILLTDSIESVNQLSEKLPSEALEFLKENNAEVKPYEYVLDYDYWKAEDILRAVLPSDLLDEVPTGFTLTGHVAHLNLRQEFKPYDSLIGQVIMDKNVGVRCVVDKVNSIATKFRTFPMKVIAGDGDLIVEQRESNCVFRFDFSKVYWNSRLHTEHARLVAEYFKAGEVVCDVFAGVGPFAVPAGKKEVIVLANDLNPESFKYLQENITANKVQKFVVPYNLDGAEFIREAPKLLLKFLESHEDGQIRVLIKGTHGRKTQKLGDQNSTSESALPISKNIPIPRNISHFVMNLPDSAISFLGNFNGVFKDTQQGDELPWIHVYCFEKYGVDEQPTMDDLYRRVHERILSAMETDTTVLPFDDLKFHLVCKVAPTKPTFCVSFKLPSAIAYK